MPRRQRHARGNDDLDTDPLHGRGRADGGRAAVRLFAAGIGRALSGPRRVRRVSMFARAPC